MRRTLPLLLPEGKGQPYGHMDPEQWQRFAQFFADALAAGGASRDERPPEAPDEPNCQDLGRAIGSGQDRAIVAALAQQFRVSENTVRGLWRAPPDGLGIPSGWHLRHILHRLDALPARERRILALRFVRGLSQAQIAPEVGISQMHVSRLLTRTLAQLRERLADDR